LENKLREQVESLLTPMLGAGNFSSEVQVDLNMDQQTSARESYDKQGAVRTETQTASQTSAGSAASGVPGVLSNTPPPQPQPSAGPPTGNSSSATPGPSPTNSDSSTSRTYELGREVAVTNAGPGKIRRLSVAVALSAAAMAKAKPGEIEQIKQLVSATVGVDTTRGDQVAVVVRNFQPMTIDQPKFWETPWFAMAVRNGVALLAVLLTLMLGVRPLIKALKRDPAPPESAADQSDADDEDSADQPNAAATRKNSAASDTPLDPEMLGKQVGLAQRLVREKPDTAVAALRQMLTDPQAEPAQ
jgi:flagellar M-ring protein FliF